MHFTNGARGILAVSQVCTGQENNLKMANRRMRKNRTNRANHNRENKILTRKRSPAKCRRQDNG